MIKKHYLEKVFATRLRSVAEPYKTNWKFSFWECKKMLAEYLIKPMEDQHFWRCSAENKAGDEYIFKNVAKPY